MPSWGEKTLEEKNIILRATDLKARRGCEIIWSGLFITVPSAASIPTTGCEYLVWQHPVQCIIPSSCQCLQSIMYCADADRKKIKKILVCL